MKGLTTMSVHAASWALAQRVFPSARKFLLFCIADNADEDDVAVFDIGVMALKVGQTPEEIRSHLEELERTDLITQSAISKDPQDLYPDGYVGFQLCIAEEEEVS